MTVVEGSADVAAPAGAAGSSRCSADVVTRLTGLAAGWRILSTEVDDDAGRVDVIRALEQVKAAAAAAQARLAADLDASQRADQAAAGVPAAERGRGVGAQVALARRDSPHRGNRHLGLAKALVHEMPHTLGALQAGRISEWRATIMVRETAVLTLEDRVAVDAEVAGDPVRLQVLEQLGDRALAARVKQVAYRLDPRSVVERSRRAEAERCVTVRPAPDTMAYLTALLPARDAIAAHVALGRAADAARNAGDPRGRGQLMADDLVDRLTCARGEVVGSGGAARERPPGPSTPRTRPGDVAVRLVMTDRALLDGDDEPAHLDGYGPVPAGWARELVADALDRACARADGPAGPAGPTRDSTEAGRTRVFLTRVFADPHGGLVGMESRARSAPPGLAALIRTRDGGTCRTPWCDAPVRHVDHVVPHADGGPTSGHNLQGLCERCNYIRQARGWHAATHDPAGDRAPDEPGGRHTVATTTPTGHTYVSTAPPLPGAPASPTAEDAGATEHAIADQDALPSATEAAADLEPTDSWIVEWLREHLATAA